jgi:hypothetical protein
VNRPPLVEPAVRTSPMRLLHLMAVRALGQRWREKMVVRASRARAPLGMSPLGIWHLPTSFFFLISLLRCFVPETHTSRGEIADFSLSLIVS